MVYRMAICCLIAGVLASTGCQENATTEQPTSGETAAASGTSASTAHSHGAGPHDGTIADWGGGKYHVEFTVDHDKQQATVFVLGGEQKTAVPIAAEKLLLSIKDPALQTELTPQPLEGETSESCSRFVGTHTGLGVVQEYEGTIGGSIDGTPYSGNFKEEPHIAH